MEGPVEHLLSVDGTRVRRWPPARSDTTTTVRPDSWTEPSSRRRRGSSGSSAAARWSTSLPPIRGWLWPTAVSEDARRWPWSRTSATVRPASYRRRGRWRRGRRRLLPAAGTRPHSWRTAASRRRRRRRRRPPTGSPGWRCWLSKWKPTERPTRRSVCRRTTRRGRCTAQSRRRPSGRTGWTAGSPTGSGTCSFCRGIAPSNPRTPRVRASLITLFDWCAR